MKITGTLTKVNVWNEAVPADTLEMPIPKVAEALQDLKEFRLWFTCKYKGRTCDVFQRQNKMISNPCYVGRLRKADGSWLVTHEYPKAFQANHQLQHYIDTVGSYEERDYLSSTNTWVDSDLGLRQTEEQQ